MIQIFSSVNYLPIKQSIILNFRINNKGALWENINTIFIGLQNLYVIKCSNC